MRFLFSATVVALFTQSCMASNPSSDELSNDDLHIVVDGKADNYYSNTSVEYEIRGSLSVELTSDEFANETIRNERAARRLTALGLYLTWFLERNWYRTRDHASMVRNRSIERGDFSGDADTGYSVAFTIDVAGPPDLLARLSGIPDDERVEVSFEIQMPQGVGYTDNHIPRSELDWFRPEFHQGPLESVRLTARARATVANAYPQYAAFVRDGVYDLTIVYGYDSWGDRRDLATARDGFHALRALGMRSPVERFEDLRAHSGPFIMPARANGRDITIEVRLFHSEMFASTRPEQHDLVLSEMAKRDVFFFVGLAGPYYGFHLDRFGAATVYPHELAQAAFDDRQQLFIAHGPQTYSQYADMVYAHPTKHEGNLDVITAVNYVFADGTEQLLRSLIQLDAQGNHQPQDFYLLIATLNANRDNESSNGFFGVIGMDGNPQLHPYANLEAVGQGCTGVDECGDPHGNVCVAETCGAVALAKTACGQNMHYVALARGASIERGACIR